MRDEGDARLVRVEATPTGIEVMERGRSLRVQRLEAELGVLTPEDREVLARAASILLSLEQSATTDVRAGR